MESLQLTASNLKDLVIFLLPGFLFLLLFFYQIPDKRKTDLITILFSVIASLVINFIAVLDIEFLNSINGLNLNLPYQGTPVFLISLLLSICFSVATVKWVKSDNFDEWSERLFKVTAAPFGRVWNRFFNIKAKVTILRVILTGKTAYIGKLDSASVDPNDQIQELILTDPYLFEMQAGQPMVKRIKETESILLRGETIESIEKIESKYAKKLFDLSKSNDE